MDSQVLKLAEETLGRYNSLTEELSDPSIFNDQNRYREGREGACPHESGCRDVAGAPGLLLRRRREARELIPTAADAEEREFYTSEAHDAEERIEELSESIRAELIDRDPNDDKDVIIEIRAGTGGDEAALFAGELLEMYSRYAERLKFKHRTLSSSPAEVGGFKDVALEIEGDRAYSVFKHEGGTHRVQRVPKDGEPGPYPHFDGDGSGICRRPRTWKWR